MNQAVLRHAVICEPLRTPVGRYGGMFKDVPATTLAETVIRELVRRTGIQGSDIDDVVFGQCYPNGEAPAIGRIAALDAELGVRVPGLQIDRRCGSGLQAVIDAAMRVQRWHQDAKGNTLIYSVNLYPSDRYVYRLRMQRSTLEGSPG